MEPGKLNEGWVKYMNTNTRYVDTISFDEKGRARYWRRSKRVETAIDGNKIRAQEISFQGIPTHATFSISGDPRDVRISVVVSHATHAEFPYRRRMCFLQDVVSLMCLPWLLTLIEPFACLLLSTRLEYPLEEHPCSSSLSPAVRRIQITRCAMLMDCHDLEANDLGSRMLKYGTMLIN